MTEAEKKKITALRQEGLGYKKIASMLGISRDSIRSYAKRNPVIAIQASQDICKGCGRQIFSVVGKKKKLFCSDKCRQNWWNSHRALVKYGYESICECCGRTFLADRRRKYCSPECYYRHRYRRSAL